MADIDALDLLKQELKEDDHEKVISAISRIDVIAISLGPERSRNELLPFLKDLADQDNDEALACLSEKLSGSFIDVSPSSFVDLVGGVDHADALLPVLERFCSIEETVVRDKASKAVCNLLPRLSTSSVTEKALPMLKRLCEGSFFCERCSAAQLIASVHKLASPESKPIILKMYIRLCNDDVPLVREAAYSHLGTVSKQLDKDLFKAHLLPIVQQLSRDNLDHLRIFSVRACIGISELLTPEENKEVSLKFLDALHTDKSWKIRDEVVNSLAEFVVAADAKNDEVAQQAASMFGKLLEDDETKVRLSCAKQFHTIAKTLVTGNPSAADYLVKNVAGRIDAFATEESIPIRIAFAASLVKASKYFGQEPAEKVVLPVLQALAKDEHPEVRDCIVSGMEELCSALSHPIVEQHLVPTIVEMSKDIKWRVRCQVVRQCSLLAKVLGKGVFEAHLLQIVLNALQDHVFAIRECGTEQVSKLLELWGFEWAYSESKLLPEALDLYNKSTNYLHRMTAILTVNYARKLMGAAEVEKILLPVVLQACKDEIANVRFCACKALIDLAESLPAPVLAEKVLPIVSSLEADSDKDVQYFASEAVKACKNK